MKEKEVVGWKKEHVGNMCDSFQEQQSYCQG